MYLVTLNHTRSTLQCSYPCICRISLNFSYQSLDACTLDILPGLAPFAPFWIKSPFTSSFPRKPLLHADIIRPIIITCILTLGDEQSGYCSESCLCPWHTSQLLNLSCSPLTINLPSVNRCELNTLIWIASLCPFLQLFNGSRTLTQPCCTCSNISTCKLDLNPAFLTHYLLVLVAFNQDNPDYLVHLLTPHNSLWWAPALSCFHLTHCTPVSCTYSPTAVTDPSFILTIFECIHLCNDHILCKNFQPLRLPHSLPDTKIAY